MAQTETRQAILDVVVKNDAALNAIASYQKQIEECKKVINDLQKKQKEGNALTEEEVKELNKNRSAQKALQKQLGEVESQVQRNIQKSQEQEGSLKSLRAELSTLTAKYDALSEAERNSAEGKAMLKHLQEVYNKIKDVEEETGRFQRNVGNYSQKTVDSFKATAGAAGSVINPIKNVTNATKALKTAGGWVGVLVNILGMIVLKMKDNESAMNAVRTALAPLNNVAILFSKVIEKLGEGLTKVAQKFTEWAQKIGLVKEGLKEEQELTASEIALEQRRREVLVANAKSDQQIAKWKAEAAEKDKLTYAQRIKLWEQVGEEEKLVALRAKELATEELRIAKARAAQGANSAEENRKLAELEAAAIQAETDYQNKLREVNAQLNAVRKEATNAAKAQKTEEAKEAAAAAKSVSDMMKYRVQEIETRLKLVQKGSEQELEMQKELLEAKFNAEIEALSREEGTKELIRLKRMEFNAEMLQLEQTFRDEEDRLLTEETNKAIEEAQRRFDAEAEIEEQRVLMKQEAALAISDVMGSLSNLAEQFADENEELAKASKVLALAQIAIETGVATAKGISQSQSVPFPANIAAIASTLATIIGGMTSAISSVKSAKFAKGGLVVGEGTATSDSIPARLSNGESVINANATSMFAPLLSSINQMGGGRAIETPTGANTAVLEQAIARGMQAAQLKVSVTEIDTVKARMDSINSIANV